VASKRLQRLHKAESGAKLLTAAEIRAMLDKADDQMRAVVLLGINCGLGNADIGALPLSALNLDAGTLTYPRPKTGVVRDRVPLWAETVDALRQVLKHRRPRPEAERIVFVNSRGGPLIDVKPAGHRVDQITTAFRRLAVAAGVHRPRMGFYWLRHTLQTIGDEARDPIAVAAIMGHADASMGGHYRETISDERLRRVTDHVRGWLYGEVKVQAAPTAEALPFRVVG
jgi:integrase